MAEERRRTLCLSGQISYSGHFTQGLRRFIHTGLRTSQPVSPEKRKRFLQGAPGHEELGTAGSFGNRGILTV